MKKLLALGFLVLVAALVYVGQDRIGEIWQERNQPSIESVGFYEIERGGEKDLTAQMDQGDQTDQDESESEIDISHPPESLSTEASAEADPLGQGGSSSNEEGENITLEEGAQESVDTQEEDTIPSEFNLAIPFTSQAPHVNWDYPYKEACEEASAYMVSLYYSGNDEETVPAVTADSAILNLVEYQEALFGYYEDTTAAETAAFIESYYHLTPELVFNPTADQIREFIAEGYPVIAPAAGQVLENPYFQSPGPPYHMLVIRGYTSSGFITNDPGTRRGQEFFYSESNLMDSIHDFNDEDATLGQKVVIVVKP